MSFLSFGKKLVGGAINSLPGGQIVTTGISALAGGGGGSSDPASPCPGSPTLDQVATMILNLTSSERSQLATAHNEANSGKSTPFTDPGLLTRRAMGGSDCVASSSAGKRFKTLFLGLVQRKGVVVDGVNAPFGDGSLQGPEGFPTSPEKVTLGSLILSPIVDTFRNIFRGAVQGGSAAADSAAQASGSTVTRSAIISSPITFAVILAALVLGAIAIFRRK